MPCYVLSCPCVMSSRVMSYVMSLRVMSHGVEHGLYFLFVQNGEPKYDNMKMRFIFSLPLSTNVAFNLLTRSSIELERPSSSVAAPFSSAALSGSFSASAASLSSLSSASFSSASLSSLSSSSSTFLYLSSCRLVRHDCRFSLRRFSGFPEFVFLQF